MSQATSIKGVVPSPAARPESGPANVDGTLLSDERRAEPRVTLLIRIAKVSGPSGEFFCVVRDASSHGVRIKIFHPLPPGDTFELEFPNGEHHSVIKVWEEGDHAGFRFAAPVDIQRLVAEVPFHLRKRQISLHCMIPGVITAGAGECDVELHHVSQYGAIIECALHLAVGERVRLESERLPPVSATVGTRRGSTYQIFFEQVFRFDDLARMCGVVAPPTNGETVARPDTGSPRPSLNGGFH